MKRRLRTLETSAPQGRRFLPPIPWSADLETDGFEGPGGAFITWAEASERWPQAAIVYEWPEQTD